MTKPRVSLVDTRGFALSCKDVGVHEAAVAWAGERWGRRVARVRALRGGWTSTMLRLTADDGAEAVLRLMTKEPWRSHASGLLTRESAVQTLLSGTPVPAPTSLAVDLTGDWSGDGTGDETGDPAHLMSFLPGHVELRRADDALIEALALLLHEVHAVDPGEHRPRDYQSWAPPSKRVVPDWAQRPALWTAAFEVLAEPPPAYDPCFLHRDFHLGNVLWTDGAVSGLVDWVETSWGPAELDVAHAATYLQLLHGGDVAGRFVEAGRPGPLDDERAYWHVLDVVGYLPDPVKVAQPWRDLGLLIDDGLARSRLEERLGDVLGRPG